MFIRSHARTLPPASPTGVRRAHPTHVRVCNAREASGWASRSRSWARPCSSGHRSSVHSSIRRAAPVARSCGGRLSSSPGYVLFPPSSRFLRAARAALRVLFVELSAVGLFWATPAVSDQASRGLSLAADWRVWRGVPFRSVRSVCVFFLALTVVRITYCRSASWPGSRAWRSRGRSLSGGGRGQGAREAEACWGRRGSAVALAAEPRRPWLTHTSDLTCLAPRGREGGFDLDRFLRRGRSGVLREKTHG